LARIFANVLESFRITWYSCVIPQLQIADVFPPSVDIGKRLISNSPGSCPCKRRELKTKIHTLNDYCRFFMIIKHFESFLENNPGAFASSHISQSVLTEYFYPSFLLPSSFLSHHLFYLLCVWISFEWSACTWCQIAGLDLVVYSVYYHRLRSSTLQCSFYDQRPWTMFTPSQMDLFILLVQGQ